MWIYFIKLKFSKQNCIVFAVHSEFHCNIAKLFLKKIMLLIKIIIIQDPCPFSVTSLAELYTVVELVLMGKHINIWPSCTR